jgi:segregation and condensation protein B
MEPSEMQAIMEAVIYVADDPVKSEQFKEVFPDASPEDIKQALESMVEAFNVRPGGMMIREVAGGYRMATRPEHHEQIRAFSKLVQMQNSPWRHWRHWRLLPISNR